MEEKKNYIPAMIIILFAIIIVLVGGLTNYKEEILKCNKADDICKITKTNLFNMTNEKTLIKISDINDISYYAQRIKGNRYSKGYREYFLAFNTKNNEKIKIFSKSYYDKNELNNAITELKEKIIKNFQNNEIEYNREN